MDFQKLEGIRKEYLTPKPDNSERLKARLDEYFADHGESIGYRMYDAVVQAIYDRAREVDIKTFKTYDRDGYVNGSAPRAICNIKFFIPEIGRGIPLDSIRERLEEYLCGVRNALLEGRDKGEAYIEIGGCKAYECLYHKPIPNYEDKCEVSVLLRFDIEKYVSVEDAKDNEDDNDEDC